MKYDPTTNRNFYDRTKISDATCEYKYRRPLEQHLALQELSRITGLSGSEIMRRAGNIVLNGNLKDKFFLFSMDATTIPGETIPEVAKELPENNSIVEAFRPIQTMASFHTRPEWQCNCDPPKISTRILCEKCETMFDGSRI